MTSAHRSPSDIFDFDGFKPFTQNWVELPISVVDELAFELTPIEFTTLVLFIRHTRMTPSLIQVTPDKFPEKCLTTGIRGLVKRGVIYQRYRNGVAVYGLNIQSRDE